MKFLADMGISPRVVTALRQQGHEAIHLNEEKLYKLPDSAILEKVRLEGCILLTHDLDFGELLAASGGVLPSVIVFRLKDMRAENVSRYLFRILEQHSKALEEGAICSVTEKRLRVRPLPL